MDLKDIQELIKFVAKSGATEVELEIDNVKISIKSPAKKEEVLQMKLQRLFNKLQQLNHRLCNRHQLCNRRQLCNRQIMQQTQENISLNDNQSSSNEEKLNTETSSNYVTVKASMIGTFYRSSSPENPPFVNVGDTIQKGDTLCIIEAMKLFNEIDSEISGTIIKVLVDDSSPIEFDQPLFLIDPS